MLAWYGATSPDPGGNPDLAYPPPTSPHFRPNMQSPGPPYQGSVASAINYSDRPYESQMASHCQSSSYPSYQPPSPYRPHPVSPPAHAHQYGNPANHQLHSGIAYTSAHQMGPYGPTQNHYGPMSQELYGNRHSMYSSGRSIQQVKNASWTESAGTTASDILQPYNQPSPRPPMMASPPHMPPPPMHSPHLATSTTPTPHPHFRQLPVPSASNHSPHSWTQSQIPSPGALHSPRTTPSPLPAHARSPGRSQPFSPPPTTPSPHHPAPAITPHPQPQKAAPASPSGLTPTPTHQPICTSPSSQVGGSDPLQSLQKMVMLDTETVESPITRASYEMANSQVNTPIVSRPGSYFSSVEQLAGSDPGSPYPTYYNLDQNRLCTPPRTCLSTPSSSTFTSVPDSASSNSPHSDSHATTASADSSTVNQVNGEAVQSNAQISRQEFETFAAPDIRMTNGCHQSRDPQGREELSRGSSDSDNRDQQEYFHCVGQPVPDGRTDIPEDDGLLTNEKGAGGKTGRGCKSNVSREGDHCNSSLDNNIERQPKNKAILWSASKRNSTLQEFEITNGQLEDVIEENSDHKFSSRSPQFYSPINRWNKVPAMDDIGGYPVGRNCMPDDCLPISLASGGKRGGRRRRINSSPHMDSDAIHSTWDPMMPGEMRGQKGHRMSRRGMRRGGRKRGGMVISNNDLSCERFENRREYSPYGMHHLHPVNGQHMVDSLKQDKDMGWQTHARYPPPSLPQGINRDCAPTDDNIQPANLRDSPGLRAPIMNPTLPNSYMFPLSPKLPTDICIDDKSSSMFPMMLAKDGNAIRYQDGVPDGMMGSQALMHDPNGQMMPPKKKRGRPCGSKNKPKPPGEQKERRIYKRRKRNDVGIISEQARKIRSFYFGPYIHISGTRERPLSITITNMPPKEDDIKFPKPKKSFPLIIRQKLAITEACATSSPLPPPDLDNAIEKQWICALCFKGSQHRGLGDLFGPYSFSDDPKPLLGEASEGAISPPPMDTCEDGEDCEEGQSSATESCQSSGHFGIIRKIRAKMKQSELNSECFKSNLYKKAKLAPNGSVMEQASVAKKADGEECSDPGFLCQYEPVTVPVNTADVPVNILNFTLLPVIKSNEQTEESESTSDPPPNSPSEPPPDVTGNDREFWVHEDCAIWSRGVCLIGQELHGLQDVVQETHDMFCSKCSIQGASLSCLTKGCTEHYHYICAIDKGCEMDESNFSILCPKHKFAAMMEPTVQKHRIPTTGWTEAF